MRPVGSVGPAFVVLLMPVVVVVKAAFAADVVAVVSMACGVVRGCVDMVAFYRRV